MIASDRGLVGWDLLIPPLTSFFSSLSPFPFQRQQAIAVFYGDAACCLLSSSAVHACVQAFTSRDLRPLFEPFCWCGLRFCALVVLVWLFGWLVVCEVVLSALRCDVMVFSLLFFAWCDWEFILDSTGRQPGCFLCPRAPAPAPAPATFFGIQLC